MTAGAPACSLVAGAPCSWVILTEVARGLVASGLIGKEVVLEHLRGLSNGHPDAQVWASEVIARGTRVKDDELRWAFGQAPDAAVGQVRFEQRLVAELLVERRHASAAHVRLAIADIAERRGITEAHVEALWAAVDDAQKGRFSALDVALAQLQLPDQGAYAVAWFLLQRTLCWPLLAVTQDPKGIGLSLPVAVDVLAQSDLLHARIEGEISLHAPPWSKQPFGSFEKAAKAAKDAWRSKHGRIDRSYRDRVAASTLLFDFSPSDHALDSLGPVTRDGDLLGATYRGMLRTDKQLRSLEAYLGQACLARLLGRRFGSRSIATGGLAPPDEGLAWRVQWSHPGEHLLDALLQKFRHVGAVGAFQRVVVPDSPEDMFDELQREVGRERRRRGGLPFVVGVSNLPELADQCLLGQWRNERYYRCSHELMRIESAGELADELKDAIRSSSKRGLYLHAPGCADEAVAAVVRYLHGVNVGYLQRSKECDQRDVKAGRRPDIPSQIGFLAFRAIASEHGNAFFASLLHAIAARTDGAELRRIDEAATAAEAAACVAGWLDHPYAPDELWESPEVLVLHGVEALREHSAAWAETLDDAPTDAWGVLRELPGAGEYQAVGDPRHRNDISRLRIILIDGSATPDPAFQDDWEMKPLELRTPATSAEQADVAERLMPVLRVLSLFRTPAPIATIVKVARILEFETTGPNDVDVLAMLQTAVREHLVVHEAGTFVLSPRRDAQQLLDGASPTALLRAHVAIASSYAPWLGLGSLLMDNIGAAAPADEWFLPHRLTEIANHIHQAGRIRRERRGEVDWDVFLGEDERDLAEKVRAVENLRPRDYKELAKGFGVPKATIYAVADPQKRVDNRLRKAHLRLIRLEYHGLETRLRRMVRADPEGPSAWEEWKRAQARWSPEEFRAQPFPVLHSAASAALRVLEHPDRYQDPELLPHLRDSLLPAMGGAAARNGKPAALRRQEFVARVLGLATRVHAGEDLQEAALAALGAEVDDEQSRGAQLAMLGGYFEYFGDSLCVSGATKAAVAWYQRGSRAGHPRSSAKLTWFGVGDPANVPDNVNRGFKWHASQIPRYHDALRKIGKRRPR